MTTNQPLLASPPIKPAYSVDEVAALLGLHRVTVSGYINTGELKAARLGYRTVRITHEALMEFLHQKEQESSEQLARRRARLKRSGGSKS
jgi:excisionase family DNA binding protein